MADIERKWYVIRTVTGTEKKTKQAIENELEVSHIKDFVTRILVPTEKTLQNRNGKKVSKEVTLYPGYVYVEMVSLEKVLHILLNVPGVLGFVGCKRKIDTPKPLRAAEIEAVLQRIDEGISKDATFMNPYVVGDEVKVIDGPFNSFTGVIEEINAEKSKLKVMVKIFGRKTPLELGFQQVEKA